MSGQKQHIRGFRVFLPAFLMLFVGFLCSCSGDGGSFSIDAHFLNMNQADFYVYSPDGAISGIDTIRVQAGRFTYGKEIEQEGTVVIVFPNYATMPVFVEPGADISIEANAAHLRTMEITGTKANELYTQWRKDSENLSPADMTRHAERFIMENPASPASRWLLLQHFILSPKPDVAKAGKMLKTMLQATDNNIHVARMQQSLNALGTLSVGQQLPRFTAKDIDGNAVLNGKYQTGSAVICFWASWNFECRSMLRQLANHQRDAADSLRIGNVLTVCLDPTVGQCRKTLQECNAENLTTVCDTMMWDSPLLKALAFSTLPDNIRLQDGKVVKRRVTTSELLKK